MARTAATKRQGLQRRSSRRTNAPAPKPNVTAPSTGLPIIDMFASPIGHLWNKLAGGKTPAPDTAHVDSDDSTGNSPYSSDSASSSYESLDSTPATTPPASSSIGPDDYASTFSTFSNAPGAYPATCVSPQKATAAPPSSPSKPTRAPSARPNRYGLHETESLYHSLPNASDSAFKEPPSPTPRQRVETSIHDKEWMNLVLTAMLEEEREQTVRAAEYHASEGVKRAKSTRDTRAWREHDGEASERAMRQAKVRFGAAVRDKEERERMRKFGYARAHGGIGGMRYGRARKFCGGAEAIRQGEKELAEALRAAERYKVDAIHTVFEWRQERKARLERKQQDHERRAKGHAQVPPPPPPSPEKKPAVGGPPKISSSPRKNPDLAKFPCFVKPGMFSVPPMPPPETTPQSSPSRPKPFKFAKPRRATFSLSSSSCRCAGPSTPRKPKTKPAEPAFTPADEAEEERARMRHDQREKRYYGMEDLASFIRRRKWEEPAHNPFEEAPRPFKRMSSPSKPAGNNVPRPSPATDMPKMPKFNATPPQPQPQSTRKTSPFAIPITADDMRVQERFDTYDSLWASVLATTSSLMEIELSFSAFPWPVFNPPASVNDISPIAVEDFVLHRLRIPRSSNDFSARRKQAVKDALLRWHPDKFLSGRVLSRVIPEDRERVREAAEVVGRILVGLVGKQ